jgi:3-deoxy-D-manno-octulosonic-acid transferase
MHEAPERGRGGASGTGEISGDTDRRCEVTGEPLQLRWHQCIVLALYRTLFTLLLLLFVLLFPLWTFTGKRRKTLLQRLGWQIYPQALSPQQPVWIHALSIGELLSAGSLIEQVRRVIGDRPLYLSVSTVSAFAIATERFTRFCDGLFYFPYDVAFSVSRCLNKVNPALVVLIETDIWPGFLAEIRQRQIPCLLVNGRLSPESFRSYNFLRVLFQPAFNTFRWVYPQSLGESERFRTIGLEPARLRSIGNLKFDVALSIPGEEALAALRQELNIPSGSRILIAGSTHPGEEDIIRSCFLKLKTEFATLRLILVPRRPERGTEVLNLFRNDGTNAALLSHPSRSIPEVVVVDRIGYLSRLYALADLAVVGGSFVPKGGQNPIEPAACGKPVLFGPDMHDFPDVSQWLLDAQGAVQARDEEGLYATCRWLLSDPQKARMMGDCARRVVTDHQGTTLKIVHDIVNVLQDKAVLS